MTWPSAKPSGVEGPPPMVLTAAGWVSAQNNLGDDVDLSGWPLDHLLAVWAQGGPLARQAADEGMRRLQQAAGQGEA